MHSGGRKKLGVALGGGGAKGFAHIGVLKELRRAGVEFDIVTGTSIGALVGALYAAGRLEEIEQEALSVRFIDIPRLFTPVLSRSGIFSGKEILDRLGRHLDSKDIESLPKPFAAVSVDLLTGETVKHTSGNILQAVRASISIPAVFTPVPLGEQLLVDGGIADPVPVQAARMLGAEVVLAVDLFGNGKPAHFTTTETAKQDEETSSDQDGAFLRLIGSAVERLRSTVGRGRTEDIPSENHAHSHSFHLVTIMERTQAIMQQQITRSRFRESPPDFVIQPPLSGVGFLDFHRASSTIEIGRQATADSLAQLLPIFSSRPNF